MIHIACCIDNAFAEYCGVLMISICENRGKAPIHFHILTNGLETSNENALKDIVKRYGQSLEVYRVDENDLKNCPIRKNDHVSIATYFRILLPVLLPESIHKILYLDCDILVLKELDDLWNIDINCHSAGTVLDEDGHSIRKYNNLEYDMALGYFNAGVMLINLDYWRRNNITREALDYINNNPEKVKLHDQDTLNYILRETKLDLPLRFNVQEGFYWRDPFIARKYWAEMYEAAENPVILHYDGDIKPWHNECRHPKHNLYRQYAALSQVKQWGKIKHVKLKLRLRIVIVRILIRLGLKAEANSFRQSC